MYQPKPGDRVMVPGPIVGTVQRPDRIATFVGTRESGMVTVLLDTGYPAVTHPEHVKPAPVERHPGPCNGTCVADGLPTDDR